MVEDGATGLLLPPADPSALAGAIVRVLTDRDLRRRLAASARRVGERHRPRRVAAQTLACYREVLADGDR
jgi:glycosyltransferase involved in cell wall biosynthesis